MGHSLEHKIYNKVNLLSIIIIDLGFEQKLIVKQPS